MLTINDLKPKIVVLIENAPYQILEVKHLHMGRGGSSVQTRIKNLATGQVYSRNFKPSDSFIQADIAKRPLSYLYRHREEYVFSTKDNSAERFNVKSGVLGEAAKWLKPKCEVEALFLSGKLLAVNLPIKMDYAVIEAPSSFRGDTSQGGSKTVIIETGAKVLTPFFISQGDIIRVNTESQEYVERVSKHR